MAVIYSMELRTDKTNAGEQEKEEAGGTCIEGNLLKPSLPCLPLAASTGQTIRSG